MFVRTSSLKLSNTISHLFLALVFLLVFLPTGSVFKVNVKLISTGLFLALFMVYLISAIDLLALSDVIFLPAVSAFLLSWALIGVMNAGTDAAQVLYQLRDISSTVFISWLSFLLIKRKVVRSEGLITVIIYAAVALAVMKLALVAAPFLSGIDIVGVIRSVFGEGSLVAGEIALGVFRMEFSADILAPFALFALLAPSVSGVRFGRVAKSGIFFVLVSSGFIAFSRYIWFVFAIAILVAAITERNWKISLITAILALVVGIPFYDFFDAAFAFRFQSDAAATSDELRVEQYKALISEFEYRPLFGAGIGANAKEVIRHDTLFYSYELQWFAFLMQFGIVGMIGLLLLVGISARDLVTAKHPAKLSVGLLFLLWLASAFTNSYLTTSFAGGTFALFMALFYRMRNSPLTTHPGSTLLEVSQHG